MKTPAFLLLLSVLSVVAISGCTQGISQGDRILEDGTIEKPDGTMIKLDGTVIKPDGTTIQPDGTTVMPDGTVVPPPPSSGYSGQLIAGSATPYLRYNKADFDQALSEGKAVYVYYYATWCPICLTERPNVLGAFNELQLQNAVGFEAHWNDGQQTAEDEELARTYGVTYQHTHLFIDSQGNLVEKTLSGLSKDQIKTKITAALTAAAGS